MATKPLTSLTLNDLLKSFPSLSPSGGFGTASPFANAPVNPASPFPRPAAPSISDIAMNRTPAPVAPAAPAPVAPVAAPRSAGPVAAPVGPTGSTGAVGGPKVPPQWLNPDGSFKTPDQIAADVGSTLKTANGNGAPDIGKLAVGQFNNGGSTADAEATARRISGTRNDIASGETDPYKVASQSGVQYTPAELKAIESAYAGVYDPALDSALAKVNAKQKEDSAKAAPFTLGENDVRYDGNGNIIAVGVPKGQTGAGSYVPGADPTADAYIKGFQSGQYKASDIPDAYKGVVAQGIAQANQNSPISKTSNDAIGIINQLTGLGDDKLGNISGTGFIGGVEHPSSLFPGTDVQNTQNLAKQLQSVLSLANRSQLKGQGAISDFEFRVLGNAASALGLDEKGRTNLSPADFKKQLNMLKVRLSVGETKHLADDEVQALSEKGYSPEDIREYDRTQQGFSSVGNTTASTKTDKNIPQRNNNPGNVKSGGLADSLATGTDDKGHLVFKTPEDGFKALTADLTAKINGNSSHLPPNPTLEQLARVYAEDPNWGKNVAAILKVPLTTPAGLIPIKDLAQAIARQEGFYA